MSPLPYRSLTAVAVVDRIRGQEDNPRRLATRSWPRKLGVLAMRRLGIIVALGALLGMFGGVVTTSSARGPKWQFLPKSPMTLPAELCGFEVGVTFPVNREFFKVLQTSADGSYTLLATGSVTSSFTNLETGKTITENVSGPAKVTFFPDGSSIFAREGTQRIPPHARRGSALWAAYSEHNCGKRSVSRVPDGSITAMSLHGHVAVDVCTALS